MSSAILIHKVPALWEVESRAKKGRNVKLSSKFEELKDLSVSENNFLKEMRSDIFFMLTKSLSEYLQINEIHVILCFDKNEVRNWEIIERDGMIDSGDGFVFWSSSSIDKMPLIENPEILIVRGNYPNFHNKIMESYCPRTTIFYPATSLLFPHFESRIKTWTKGVSDGSVSLSEMEMVVSTLAEETIFSRSTPPDFSTNKNKNVDMEIRRQVRNYCLECAKNAANVRNRKSPGEYPIVLYDELENLDVLRSKYPNSELLKFNKASSPIFELDLQSDRDIDIIFTGTTIQKTKNQDLFYQLVDRILKIRPTTKISIVGVEKNKDELLERWPNHEVEIFERVDKKSLRVLYNRSKIHLITSGRDCFPRTIPESISCGCFNVALDILSDGLSFIRANPILGKVVDTSGSIIKLEPNYNVTIAIKNDFIEKQIIEQIEIEHSPLAISLLGNSLLPLHEMVQMDKVWEIIDLTKVNP